VDVWALGVEMYMLLVGEFPFDDPDEEVLEDQIIEGKVDMTGPGWVGISWEAKDLLKGLLSVNPKHRPNAAQALEHAWFTGFNQNSSASLHHAHTRLRELAASTRLPTRRFAPGAFKERSGNIQGTCKKYAGNI
jgi:serine/threonine protein kinase